MQILDRLTSTLDLRAEVQDIRQGPFQTAVLTRGCGLASTPHDPGFHHDHSPVRAAGSLREKSVEELVHMAYSASPFEAAIGMAAINSLLDIDDDRCVELNAADVIMAKGEGKSIAIVGHFPFVAKLRQMARELWVIERRPHEGDFPEEEAERLIPEADVVGITGMAFINHTIDHLLSLCRPEAYVIILGGTAPLSPVLFGYGVNAVSGTRVVDPGAVLRAVSQGATFRQLKGVRRLTMEAWERSNA